MKQLAEASGPSFGLAVLIPASLLLLVVAVLAASRIESRAGRFLFAALWARMLLGAFHVYMFKPLFAGFSGNALVSIAVVGIGLLIIRVRHLMLAALLPAYLLMLIILIGGALNGDMAGPIGVVIKYAYFIVILVATFEALRQDDGQLMSRLIWAFAPLLLFQALSLALHLPKGAEAGDGLVWIGGFNHEAAFSVALTAGFLATCLAHGLKPALRIGFLCAMLAGIVLAGYRTTIFAVAPLALAIFWAVMTLHVTPQQRRAVAAVMLVVCLVGAAVFAVLYQARFADLGAFLADPGALIKPPREFTQVERNILSARPLIWSRYLYAYAEGQPFQHLFGFGAESWTKAFDVYPHNTLISTLYELGMLGVIAMLLLWTSMAALAFKARRHDRLILVAAHLSFFLLNMATMPFWQVEGLALYGLLCGYTLFSARAAMLERSQAARGPAQRRRRVSRSGESPYSSRSIARQRR
jgi:hypothetical protein